MGDKAMNLEKSDLQSALLRKEEDAMELKRLIKKVDQDTSGTLSKDEFKNIYESQQIRHFFELRGLDIKDVATFFHLVTSVSGSEEIEISSLISGCMGMRCTASAMDLHALSAQVHVMQKRHEVFADKLARELSEILFALSSLHADGMLPQWRV